VVGLAVGLILAYLVAMFPDEQGNYYYWEIMIPGALVGLILGYVTQRYGRAATKAAAQQ
jgi:peptidoglycan/LPS O-acetylase OafA/YrhL